MKLTPADIFGSCLDADEKTLKRVLALIRDIDFSTYPPYNLIQQVFVHCVEVHKRWTLDLIEFHLKNQWDDIEPYIRTLVLAKAHTDVEYVIENIYEYRVTNILQQQVPSLLNRIDEEKVLSLTRELNKLTLWKRDQGGEVVSATQAIRAVLCAKDEKELGPVLPLRLGFDDVMEGGIHPGEVMLVIAPTGGGKTSFLLRTATQAALSGFRVFFASLEIGEELIAKRLYRWCVATNNEINKLENLHLKSFPSKKVTLDEVFWYVDENHYDVVVIDYLDLLLFDKATAVWLELEDLTAYFRGMLKERQLIGLSASQVNREGAAESNRRVLQLTDVSYSMGKVFTADYVLTLTPYSNGDNSSSNMYLYLCKNRRGPTWLQPCRCDFASITFEPVVCTFTSLPYAFNENKEKEA